MRHFSYDQAYLFNTGNDLMSYNLLGSHYFCDSGLEGYTFCVWAPEADSVSVVGDFNGWDTESNRLEAMGDTGLFWGQVIGAAKWDNYKYCIKDKEGNQIFKADPYAFHSETRPGNCSKLYPLNDRFEWTDDEYISNRSRYGTIGPINIYEVHLGSWKKSSDGDFLNYRTIAHKLAEYILDMRYTHVELMPVMEHPLDDSWGYQVTGFYSPTSRFGTPEDFKYFVDHMHSKGIGVILDWVPGHFPKDDFALGRFDGSAVYEYADDRLGEHKEWGTYVFNYARAEVRSFLLSNAFFWIKEFHADGLRVDAVSSMIYLNYGRENHVFNRHGGVENLEAISFIQTMNDSVHKYYPGVIMIAEESTAWPRVTGASDQDGLRFDYKWNMGWMHDTIDYFNRDYIYRRWHHSQLSFSLIYAFSENFILPLSHDEVVHGKRSMIDKMPGDNWRKFASLRTLYAYMIAHPGCKLTFMGNEFGQFIEWRFYEQLEWFLLEYPNHKTLQKYVSELNKFYLNNRALWDSDNGWDGFKWNTVNDADNCVYAFSRVSGSGDEILVVLNMTPSAFNNYKIGVRRCKGYLTVLNSDMPEYGGSGFPGNLPDETFYAYDDVGYNDHEGSIVVDIPPNSALYLKLYERSLS
ncbi:MAG: 1,4-alpha-glucan branching protein GlgB [Eubacteriales bacterium]|nr:1,4-alpha-glucan branching protein GlgB [Eubacteriales bacterium]MDD4717234.1 1,4-alpha-glucan branching protein GlgB [Eubacteriales bacterium]